MKFSEAVFTTRGYSRLLDPHEITPTKERRRRVENSCPTELTQSIRSACIINSLAIEAELDTNGDRLKGKMNKQSYILHLSVVLGGERIVREDGDAALPTSYLNHLRDHLFTGMPITFDADWHLERQEELAELAMPRNYPEAEQFTRIVVEDVFQQTAPEPRIRTAAQTIYERIRDAA